MYYAVLRKEVKHPCSGGVLTLKIGGVYEIQDRYNDATGETTILYRSIDLMETPPEPYGQWFEMALRKAREHFTEPFNELDTVIEESFLVCESAYC